MLCLASVCNGRLLNKASVKALAMALNHQRFSVYNTLYSGVIFDSLSIVIINA